MYKIEDGEMAGGESVCLTCLRTHVESDTVGDLCDHVSSYDETVDGNRRIPEFSGQLGWHRQRHQETLSQKVRG